MSKAPRGEKRPVDVIGATVLVGKRLGANADMKEFDAKMRKIAKAKPKSGAAK